MRTGWGTGRSPGGGCFSARYRNVNYSVTGSFWSAVITCFFLPNVAPSACEFQFPKRTRRVVGMAPSVIAGFISAFMRACPTPDFYVRFFWVRRGRIWHPSRVLIHYLGSQLGIAPGARPFSLLYRLAISVPYRHLGRHGLDHVLTSSSHSGSFRPEVTSAISRAHAAGCPPAVSFFPDSRLHTT